jgi:hypothetical protein
MVLNINTKIKILVTKNSKIHSVTKSNENGYFGYEDIVLLNCDCPTLIIPHFPYRPNVLPLNLSGVVCDIIYSDINIINYIINSLIIIK